MSFGQVKFPRGLRKGRESTLIIKILIVLPGPMKHLILLLNVLKAQLKSS